MEDETQEGKGLHEEGDLVVFEAHHIEDQSAYHEDYCYGVFESVVPFVADVDFILRTN